MAPTPSASRLNHGEPVLGKVPPVSVGGGVGAGVPGITITTWFGLLAPAGPPKPIANLLHNAVIKAMQSPEFKAQLEDAGAEPVGNTQEEMAKQISDEIEKFATIIRIGKITAN